VPRKTVLMLRWRQEALASEGYRPRSRGNDPLADLAQRWRDLRGEAAGSQRQGQPQDVPRRAEDHSCPSWRDRIVLWLWRRWTSTQPKTKLLVSQLDDYGVNSALLVTK
jgi:hypothetical protein